jgi:hypothetical protein
MNLRIFLAISLLIPAEMFAGAADPQGVWSGSIGTKSVVACFNNESGNYYYVDHLKPIGLDIGDTALNWSEYGDTGQWQLTAPAEGFLAGTWSHSKAKKKLPIKLKLIDGRDDDTACSRNSYHSQLEVVQKVSNGKMIEFSKGRSYRKLQFLDQAKIELVGPDKGIDRINASLKPDMSKNTVDSYFRNRREILGRIGRYFDDEVNAKPVYWDAHFVSIQFYRWAAGTGARGVTNDYETWSTVTGEKVDLWRWLGSSSGEKKLPPKLHRYLLDTNKPDPNWKPEPGEAYPDCTYYYSKGMFVLELTKSGMDIYEAPYGNGDCEEGFQVPYPKLLPFLSPEGTKAVNSILGRK